MKILNTQKQTKLKYINISSIKKQIYNAYRVVSQWILHIFATYYTRFYFAISFIIYIFAVY